MFEKAMIVRAQREKIYQQANEYFYQGDCLTAAQFFYHAWISGYTEARALFYGNKTLSSTTTDLIIDEENFNEEYRINIALCLMGGLGIQRDHSKAISILEELVEPVLKSDSIKKHSQQSVTTAHILLGWMNYHQLGVNRKCDIRDRKAIVYLQAAADLGHVLALTLLGDMYEAGRGVVGTGDKNGKQALIYYQRAAELGSSVALMRLGTLHEAGRVLSGKSDENDRKALEYYQKATELDNQQALELLVKLGIKYLWSLDAGGASDAKQRIGVECLKQVTEFSHDASFWIGWAYYEGISAVGGKSDNNDLIAVNYFKQAAPSCSGALRFLGKMYLDGRVVGGKTVENDSLGMSYLTRAVDLDYWLGAIDLGNFYVKAGDPIASVCWFGIAGRLVKEQDDIVDEVKKAVEDLISKIHYDNPQSIFARFVQKLLIENEHFEQDLQHILMKACSQGLPSHIFTQLLSELNQDKRRIGSPKTLAILRDMFDLAKPNGLFNSLFNREQQIRWIAAEITSRFKSSRQEYHHVVVSTQESETKKATENSDSHKYSSESIWVEVTPLLKKLTQEDLRKLASYPKEFNSIACLLMSKTISDLQSTGNVKSTWKYIQKLMDLRTTLDNNNKQLFVTILISISQIDSAHQQSFIDEQADIGKFCDLHVIYDLFSLAARKQARTNEGLDTPEEITEHQPDKMKLREIMELGFKLLPINELEKAKALQQRYKKQFTQELHDQWNRLKNCLRELKIQIENPAFSVFRGELITYRNQENNEITKKVPANIAKIYRYIVLVLNSEISDINNPQVQITQTLRELKAIAIKKVDSRERSCVSFHKNKYATSIYYSINDNQMIEHLYEKYGNKEQQIDEYSDEDSLQVPLLRPR